MRKEQMQPKKRKGPGRPATGKGEMIGVRIQPVPLSALDAFVADQPEPTTRPEAIRMILMKFFRSKGYLSKTSDVPSERNPGSSSSTKRVRPLTYREPMRFETRESEARPGEHKLASGVNNAPMGEK